MAAGRTGICIGYRLDVLLMTTPHRPVNGATNDSPDDGLTRPGRHGHREPRLPHEHDESSDSHPGTEDGRIKQAARDLESGQQDTGRTPVVTELARREFPSETDQKPKL